MGEVDEDFEAFANDVVAFFAFNAGYQAHAASIVFIARMIKTLRLPPQTCRSGSRQTMMLIRYLHGYLLRNEIGLQFQRSGTAKDTMSEAFSKGIRRDKSRASPSWQAQARGDSAEIPMISENASSLSRIARSVNFGRLLHPVVHGFGGIAAGFGHNLQMSNSRS